ncbi:MAG: putative baseplate assembly protein, partial [Chloroflexi bacterium]
MESTAHICDNEQRRQDLFSYDTLNGLDYLDIKNDTTLQVFFFEKAPANLSLKNIVIKGGRRIRDLEAVDFEIRVAPEPDVDDCLIVKLNKTGDFSTYTLCLVALDENKRPTNTPYPNFDPRYFCLTFSFDLLCPSDLDCVQPEICLPTDTIEP